ncbi:DNA-binding response regulator [Paenibacillus montaniterrae]|uniref:DNA-binding response regulator n=1 Tax=Paenibacillus montaniterrae TaxID=429341 RepID=A0A919YMF3_9BACL|nr:response regulator [Paenibacillus montaniterrae]GIP15925.1 DNA-binding response regulator [Paenibacillus montaniterrae]
MTYRVLVTDDEKHSRLGVSSTLQTWFKDDMQVDTAVNGSEALELIQQQRYDLLITDIRMPQMSGLELLEALRKRKNGLPTILLTGFAEFEYAQQGIKLGAADYLLKPVHQEQLIATVQRVLEQLPADSKSSSSETEIELTSRNPYIIEAMQYMETYMAQSFTIKDISSYVHLNPSYFSVLFKDEVGVPFTDYVIQMRTEKAKALLRDSQLSLEQICERIGIQSTSYFIKMFKKSEGVTPKQYRESKIK